MAVVDISVHDIKSMNIGLRFILLYLNKITTLCIKVNFMMPHSRILCAFLVHLKRSTLHHQKLLLPPYFFFFFAHVILPSHPRLEKINCPIFAPTFSGGCENGTIQLRRRGNFYPRGQIFFKWENTSLH